MKGALGADLRAEVDPREGDLLITSLWNAGEHE